MHRIISLALLFGFLPSIALAHSNGFQVTGMGKTRREAEINLESNLRTIVGSRGTVRLFRDNCQQANPSLWICIATFEWVR